MSKQHRWCESSTTKQLKRNLLPVLLLLVCQILYNWWKMTSTWWVKQNWSTVWVKDYLQDYHNKKKQLPPDRYADHWTGPIWAINHLILGTIINCWYWRICGPIHCYLVPYKNNLVTKQSSFKVKWKLNVNSTLHIMH